MQGGEKRPYARAGLLPAAFILLFIGLLILIGLLIYLAWRDSNPSRRKEQGRSSAPTAATYVARGCFQLDHFSRM